MVVIKFSGSDEPIDTGDVFSYQIHACINRLSSEILTVHFIDHTRPSRLFALITQGDRIGFEQIRAYLQRMREGEEEPQKKYAEVVARLRHV